MEWEWECWLGVWVDKADWCLKSSKDFFVKAALGKPKMGGFKILQRTAGLKNEVHVYKINIQSISPKYQSIKINLN